MMDCIATYSLFNLHKVKCVLSELNKLLIYHLAKRGKTNV